MGGCDTLACSSGVSALSLYTTLKEMLFGAEVNTQLMVGPAVTTVMEMRL